MSIITAAASLRLWGGWVPLGDGVDALKNGSSPQSYIIGRDNLGSPIYAVVTLEPDGKGEIRISEPAGTIHTRDSRVSFSYKKLLNQEGLNAKMNLFALIYANPSRFGAESIADLTDRVVEISGMKKRKGFYIPFENWINALCCKGFPELVQAALEEQQSQEAPPTT